jgi:DMSO/TMAO reductase YedYZ molybdopterin-dependent catalytic subunit
MFFGVSTLSKKTPEPLPEVAWDVVATKGKATGTSNRPALPSPMAWPVTLESDSPYWPEPQAAAQSWKLELDGQVEQPSVLTYRELLTLPQAFQLRRIVDKAGWSVKAEWEGVLLKHLVSRVKANTQAEWLLQTSANGQQQWLPLKELIQQEALIALRYQGQPLEAWHGGPVRLLVFDRAWHMGLGQLTHLTFAPKPLRNLAATPEELANKPEVPLTPEEKGHAPIDAGKVYAFDLKQIKTIERAGEIKHF